MQLLFLLVIISIHLTCSFEIAYFKKLGSRTVLFSLSNLEEIPSVDQNIFGKEFEIEPTNNLVDNLYWKGKQYTVSNSDKRLQSMEGFKNLRASVLADSLLISVIGFSITWFCGSYKDAYSFGIGAILGIGYAVLLSTYVEKIGTGDKSTLRDAIRFAPIIFLIALYGKYKLTFSIVPELLGYFSSYQLASFLQIFNSDAYGDENKSK
eukprot:gene16031-21757_t